MHLGLDLDLGGDNYAELPPAEPFSPRQRPEAQHSSILRSSTHEPTPEEESSVYAAAQVARKARKPKVTAYDRSQELARDVIQGWQDNYLSNMAEAHEKSLHGRAQALAKRNAEFWIWGSGLGGIGSILGPLSIDHPLAGFFGKRLFDTITGADTTTTGYKRPHEVDPTAAESDRRVRQRTSSAEEDARGADEAAPFNTIDDDLGMDLNMDDDLEIGRNAPTPLPGDLAHDLSSSMPWNISAARSRQSSLRLPPSRASTFAFPIIGPGRASLSSTTPLYAPLGLRASSRLVSASPLHSHGGHLLRQGSIAPIDFTGGQGTSSAAHEFDFGMVGDEAYLAQEDEGEGGGAQQRRRLEEERERFGPAAGVDTQTAGESQWVRDVMEHESHNFLEFVEAVLAGRVEGRGKETVEAVEEVTFEALLPSERNSAVVAAQGLLHSLSLATRGLLVVQQEEPFGEIRFSMPVARVGA